MCISPVIIKNPKWNKAKQSKNDTMYLAVPCGKCIECLNSRRAQWSYRLNKEFQYYPDWQCCFVSLDYDDNHLPIDFASQKPTLDKMHLKKFIKSIRNDNPDVHFKYYAVGEYGETFHRPHYHILFFGVPIYFDFSKYWNKGRVDVGEVEPASIHYVAGYFLLISDNFDKPVPPFNLMSKGIGLQHYLDFKDDYVRYYCNNQSVHINNFTTPLPRYFKEMIKRDFINLPEFKPEYNVYLESDVFILNENYKNKISKKPKLLTLKK